MLLRILLIALLATLIVAQDDHPDIDVEMPENGNDISKPTTDSEATPGTSEVEVEDIPYATPIPIGNSYIAEHFDDREDFGKRWIPSEAKKDGVEAGLSKYDGKWSVEEAEKSGLKGDLGLVLKSKARHHAISARLEKPFAFDNKPFILQYEVRFQNGQECGGAYLKLLSQDPNMDLRKFHDKTPYTLMFGPDKCGNDHKLHFIFRHRNPKNGSFEEKHWKRTTTVPKFDDVFKDKKPHLFTLIINPDNKFEVLVDKHSIQKGSLLDDFHPPVNPEAEIDDPSDSKPSDWDEREKIADTSATKPDNWDEDAPRQIVDPNAKKPTDWLDDEPELLPDPNAEKPADWDDEMDGEWEAPLISNPKCEKVGCGKWKAPMIDNPDYKGKWRAPLIDNPNYKGKWKPRRVPNPHYYQDKYPYKMTPIAAVGFELWSMVDGIMFDNVIITDDLYVAEHWASETFDLKRELADRETDNTLIRLFKYTNKNPWLWAVYLVVIGLPVVLFISFCCTSSRPPAHTASQRGDDSRYSDKQKKLLKQMDFSEVLNRKVDMNKVNLDAIKPWIAKRLTDILEGIEDDATVEFIYSQLKAEKSPDARMIQVNLTGFLNGKNTKEFMADLWSLIISAEDSEDGIPPGIKDMDKRKTDKIRDVPKEATITEVKEEEEDQDLEEEEVEEDLEMLDNKKNERKERKEASDEEEEEEDEEEELLEDQDSGAVGDYPRRRKTRKD